MEASHLFAVLLDKLAAAKAAGALRHRMGQPEVLGELVGVASWADRCSTCST